MKNRFRLRLFDVVMICVFLVLCVSLFLILFRAKKDLTITIKVNEDTVVWPNRGVEAWFSQVFKPGMEEKDNLGKTVAKLVRVNIYDTDPAKKTAYLTLTVKSVYTRGNNQYTYKGKNILIGSTIRFYLDQVMVDGLVVNIEEKGKTKHPKTIKLETQLIDDNLKSPDTYGVPAFIPAQIQEGTVVKNPFGDVILKLITKRVEDADRTVALANGQIIIAKDPLRKDVYLTFEIVVNQINHQYFYLDDIPVYVGGRIPVVLDKITLYPTVTNIIDQ